MEANVNREHRMQNPDANRPETRRDTYEWEIIQTCDLQIADTKEAWIVHQLRVTGNRDNCKLISEASRTGDSSEPKSVKANYNEFIIQKIEGDQSWHHWDSIT
jgi:hypothetical protein